MKKTLTFINELIIWAEQDNVRSKIENPSLTGDSFILHHLKLLKTLCEEEAKDFSKND